MSGYDFRKIDNVTAEHSFYDDDLKKTMYVLIEPCMLFVSEYPKEVLLAKIETASKTDDDNFFNSLESYALDDLDASYFEDSKYRDEICSTFLYYVCMHR